MLALRDALRDLPEAVFADLYESDEAYLVVLDVPGATADTVDVTVDDGRLHIEARREKTLPAGYSYLREDRSLFLDVDLPLPPRVDGKAADATVERGVLELRLPKSTGGTRVPVETPDS